MNSDNGKKSIFKNFTALFTGLLLVQLINFLFSLILPKYFSPNAFAEFGIFTSLVFIFIEVVNAKLDMAVMLTKEPKDTKKLLDGAFTFAVIISFIVLMACVPICLLFSKVYILLPFTLLLYGIHQPILVYLNKQGKYSTINIFRIIQVLTTSLVTIILGREQVSHSLILGFVSGLLLASLYSIRFSPPRFSLTALKESLKEYDQFPKYGTWSSLINNLSRNSIPLVLAQFFSQQLVGFYSYSTRLLNAPSGMYNSALSQVYFKMASEESHETVRIQTKKIILFSLLVSIIPTLLLLFFGQEFFFLLFSGEWIEAGKITQYLILWYFMRTITSPITSILDVRNELKFEFRVNIILLAAGITSIIIGGLLNNFYLSLLLYSISGILINLYLLYFINFNILKKEYHR